MKELGRGWQYTAYDLGTGRVLKKYNSWPRAYMVMLHDMWKYRPHHMYKIPSYFIDCKQKARTSMKLVKDGCLDPWMMGNPRVLNELEYEQDVLVPLHSRLNGMEVDDAKNLIDEFVAFNRLILGHGVIDKSFNINKNFGIDKQGRIVLMDLGELFSDPAAITERRRRRSWASPYISTLVLNSEVRTYYLEQMDKYFAIPAPEEM